MTNKQSPNIRQLRPASTTDVLPPVQRYAPACRADSSRRSSPSEAEAPSEGRTCRAETPPVSESRITPRPEGLESGNHASDLPLLGERVGVRGTAAPANPEPPPTRDRTSLPAASLVESPSIQNSSAAPRKVSRNGKIARLPHPVRDMINRMLRNNIPHPKISEALAEHGVTATPRNISNWKTRGGYREWCDQQDRAVETHLLQDNLIQHLRTTDATQLSEVGLQLVATQLSQFFLKQDIRDQLTADPEKFSTAINALCRLNRQLYRLQKYRDDSARELGPRHNPERIKREVEKDLEGTRHTYSAEKLGQTIDDYDIPHRNFISKNPRAYLALEDSEQDFSRPPADPLQALSTLTSLLKNHPAHVESSNT